MREPKPGRLETVHHISDPMETQVSQPRHKRTMADQAGSWRVLHWAAVLVTETEGHKLRGGPKALVDSCLTRFPARGAQE